jgi:hypothetical protein
VVARSRPAGGERRINSEQKSLEEEEEEKRVTRERVVDGGVLSFMD